MDFVNKPTADQVTLIAQAIAQCDFMTKMSRYTTGQEPDSWVITVGENEWRRHLVVNQVTTDASDAQMFLLKRGHPDPVMGRWLHNPSNIERTIMLKELIANSYTGVKQMLYTND